MRLLQINLRLKVNGILNNLHLNTTTKLTLGALKTLLAPARPTTTTPKCKVQVSSQKSAHEGRNPLVKNGVYKFGEQMLSKDVARVNFKEGIRNYFSLTTKLKTA